MPANVLSQFFSTASLCACACPPRTRGDVRGGWRPRAGGRARGARVDRGGGGTRLLLVVEAGGGGGVHGSGEGGVQARVRVELLRQLAHARVRRVRRRRHGAVGVNAPAPMCVHMCAVAARGRRGARARKRSIGAGCVRGKCARGGPAKLRGVHYEAYGVGHVVEHVEEDGRGEGAARGFLRAEESKCTDRGQEGGADGRCPDLAQLDDVGNGSVGQRFEIFGAMQSYDPK